MDNIYKKLVSFGILTVKKCEDSEKFVYPLTVNAEAILFSDFILSNSLNDIVSVSFINEIPQTSGQKMNVYSTRGIKVVPILVPEGPERKNP